MKDPVCGMEVAPERAAARIEHSGSSYDFCSAGCAAKFRADPDRYAAPKPVPPPPAPRAGPGEAA